MNRMSDDAKAILLLCGRLGNASDCQPLSQHQYNKLARWLKNQQLRPADLLEDGIVPRAAQGSGIDEQRLVELLKRGVQLGFAVETWNSSGIWVNCRSDPDYPARYKQHLKEKAPPILFGAGNRSLLEGGGLAIVGSRNVDTHGERFAREVAAWCAQGSTTVISGGARGVDQIAMQSALDAGGCVIGILAESLLRKSVARDARHAIAEDRLLLISPYHPEARFTVGTAMGRNKLIYAMADYGLVVNAEYEKGGTWAGADEELKRRPARSVFVRTNGDVPVGNRKLLDLGAVAFPREWRERSPVEVLKAPSMTHSAESNDHPLFSVQPQEERSAENRLHGTPSPLEPIQPAGERHRKATASSEPTTIYRAVLPLILSTLQEPTTIEELATRLEVGKGQLQAWLRQAVDERRIEKRTRPVRYVTAEK